MIRYPADYNPIMEYWEQISSGQETVCRKIYTLYRYLAWLVEHPGEYFYSTARANHVIEFAENYCCPAKGYGAGKAVRLELWEKAHLAAVFGFVDINGLRMCRESVLIVGKKNGKSLLASIVGLYMQTGDGEPGPEVYAVATKRDQAKIIWMEAKRMVKKSRSLLRRIRPLVGELSSEDFNNGTFKPLASDSDSLDGLNVHCVLMDEIHQWKNGTELYNIMADGTSARTQPLVYITSTAGTIRKDIYDSKYAESERVINGLFMENGYKDVHFLPFVYELDKREEWQDEACWKKANPGLGTIKRLDNLRAKVKKAVENPALVKNLVCKEFNIRETSESAWLTFEEIVNVKTFDITELKPRYGIGGADLSSSTDLTCSTVIFRVPDDDVIYVLQMYFLPEELVEKRSHEDHIPYDQWAEQGLLRLCEGNKVYYRDVVSWFEEVEETHDIYIFKAGYDSWSADYFVKDMQNRFGAEVMEPVIQGKKTLSSPMKSLGADICAKRVNYNQNPILEWCLYNTSVDTDKNGNIQPVKTDDRTKRIDGFASLLDAYVAYERNMEEYLSVI